MADCKRPPWRWRSTGQRSRAYRRATDKSRCRAAMLPSLNLSQCRLHHQTNPQVQLDSPLRSALACAGLVCPDRTGLGWSGVWRERRPLTSPSASLVLGGGVPHRRRHPGTLVGGCERESPDTPNRGLVAARLCSGREAWCIIPICIAFGPTGRLDGQPRGHPVPSGRPVPNAWNVTTWTHGPRPRPEPTTSPFARPTAKSAPASRLPQVITGCSASGEIRTKPQHIASHATRTGRGGVRTSDHGCLASAVVAWLLGTPQPRHAARSPQYPRSTTGQLASPLDL